MSIPINIAVYTAR